MLLHKSKTFFVNIALCCLSATSFSQMNASFTTTPNTNCNGSGCNYTGPSILINEIFISPSNNTNGSLFGPSGANPGQGEWIELYNPNVCEPVDISCFYLGNNANDNCGLFNTGNFPGGYVIPAGTVVPPAGFCVIRGANAPEIPANSPLLLQNGGNVIQITVEQSRLCIGSGCRLWFPDAGSWFAFYDANGVAQDAISWASAANTAQLPCIPPVTDCNTFPGPLQNYNDIDPARKNYIVNVAISGATYSGKSIRRIPDGGDWAINTADTPTQGLCNATCIPPSASSCTGTAAITVTGGTAPYTYAWNDTQSQLTATANGLCAGTYQVIVTDATTAQQTFSVDVVDFIPPVTLTITPEICIDGGTVEAVPTPVASGSAVGNLTGTGLSGTTFNPQTAGAGSHVMSYNYTDEQGCVNDTTATIIVHPLPIVSISNNASPYCVSDIPANLTLSPSGGTLTGNGVVNNDFVPSAAGVGTHTLTYEYTDANGCTNSTTIDVVVVGIPNPVIVGPDQFCIHDNAHVYTATPTGGSFTINGIASTNGEFDPAVIGAGNHTIGYTYTNPEGCQATDDHPVVVLDRPVLNLAVMSNYCFETTTVNLSPNPAGGTLSGIHATATGLNLTDATPGNYSVTYDYTDVNGCENTITSTYNVTSPLSPTFTTTSDCFQVAQFLTPIIGQNILYVWTINGEDILGNPNATLAFDDHGIFPITLTVTDQYNCSYDTTGTFFVAEGVSANVFVVPNVITPNGDQINDVLTLPALLNECLEYNVLILNRWGNVVFEMNPTTPFLGKDKNGEDLSSGVYFYTIISDDFDCEAPEYKGFCHGNITIIRE